MGTGSNASAVGAYTAENLAVFDFALCGNAEICLDRFSFLTHFSRISHAFLVALRATAHAPCEAPVVRVVLGY